MNKIRVILTDGWYWVQVDDRNVLFRQELQQIIDWLEENFAPPISVRWSVDARSKQEIKEKYSY